MVVSRPAHGLPWVVGSSFPEIECCYDDNGIENIVNRSSGGVVLVGLQCFIEV